MQIKGKKNGFNKSFDIWGFLVWDLYRRDNFMTLFERLVSVFKHFTFTRRIRKKENAHRSLSVRQLRQVFVLLFAACVKAARWWQCCCGQKEIPPAVSASTPSSSNVEAVITVAFRFLKELERFLFFLYLTWLFLSAQLLRKILWQMIGTEAFTISQVFRRVWSVSQLLVFSDMQIGHCIII